MVVPSTSSEGAERYERSQSSLRVTAFTFPLGPRRAARPVSTSNEMLFRRRKTCNGARSREVPGSPPELPEEVEQAPLLVLRQLQSAEELAVELVARPPGPAP